MELQLKFDDIEINKESIFKQHSSLITFKIENNSPYFKVDTEKAIFTILLDTQMRMNKLYSEYFKESIQGIFDENFEKKLFKNIYNLESLKDDIVKNSHLEKQKLDFLIQKIEEIKDIKLKKLSTSPLSQKEKDLLLKDIESTRYERLLKGEENTELENNISQSEFIYRAIIYIKNHCKDNVVELMSKKRYINFNSLVKAINCTTSTRLKKNLEETENLKLSFNFINKKKLEVKLLPTSILNSIKFFRTESKITWLSYIISQEILELIMLPEIFASLPYYDISKIKGKYTFRLYSLLLDHIKYGRLEITKEELFEFLGIPNTAQKNKSVLESQILIPTLDEIKEISNLNCSYEFVPIRNFNKIIFKFKAKNNGNIVYNYPKIEDFSDYQARIKTKKEKHLKFDDDILKQIEKTKRNIYVAKAWNVRVDNKIKKIIEQKGKEFCLEILKNLKESLKYEIKTSLVQYINGIIKNKKEEEYLNLLNKLEENKVEKNSNESNLLEIKEINLVENKNKTFQDFLNIKDVYEKLKIEEQAINIGINEGTFNDVALNYIFKTKEINIELYYSIIKDYIIKVLNNKE